MRAVADRLLRALERAAGGYFGRDDCSHFAAAISFRVLFALFPFLILLVTILGLVLQDDDIRTEVVDWIEQVVPLSEEADIDLTESVEGLATPLSVVGFVSLVGLLWSASGLAAALQVVLNRIWQADRSRPAARAKLIDFALVGAGGLLVLVSFGLTILVQVVQEAAEDAEPRLGGLGTVLQGAGRVTELLIPFAITFATFVLLYRLIPVVRPRFRDVWVGAGLAALGFEAAKIGFAYYLANFSRYNVIYGSLGAVVAFLFFVYLGATIFLFGAEIAAAWPGAKEPDPGPGTPFKQKVRGFVRKLFVHDQDQEPPREKI